MINPQRCRTIRKGRFNGNSVLYWMNRDKRINDNWALLAAQQCALKNNSSLIVCYNYLGTFPEANIRQYGFLFKGLKEVHEALCKLNIDFFLLNGQAHKTIPDFVERMSIGTIFTDYNPLNIYKKRIDRVAKNIRIPFYQIDAHNIVPCWIASEKKEYAAYTIRGKISKKLNLFLTDIPKVTQHPIGRTIAPNWSLQKVLDSLKIDHSVKEVDWILPGPKQAEERLDVLKFRLKDYSVNRNDPTKNALSNMSPYFHFGHISPQRVAYEIKESDLPELDKSSFLEEMIIRRELSDNFCEYEKNYDHFEGFHQWAQNSLNEHRNDEREYLYTPEQFEIGDTHEHLWNAAQNQMVETGKMHGYMRMYWAKKILEWSPSPEIALQTAIDLNDKYELDGRDPNGYAGIAWSIGGIHDRAWFERPIFGKIRYMNYNGCKSKFNVKKYIETYGSG